MAERSSVSRQRGIDLQRFAGKTPDRIPTTVGNMVDLMNRAYDAMGKIRMGDYNLILKNWGFETYGEDSLIRGLGQPSSVHIDVDRSENGIRIGVRENLIKEGENRVDLLVCHNREGKKLIIEAFVTKGSENDRFAIPIVIPADKPGNIKNLLSEILSSGDLRTYEELLLKAQRTINVLHGITS